MAIEKKNLVLGIVGAAASVSGAVSASAADLQSATADWAGAYAGGSVGVLGGYAPLLDGEGYELDKDATIGGFVGYNIDLGHSIVGAEIAYQGSTDFDYDTDYQINEIADLKLRFGKALSDKVMVYAVAGLSAGSARQYDSSYDYSFWGVNVGAGVDVALVDNFTIGAEYLARNLSSYDWSEGDNESSGITSQFSLRAAYNF